MWASVLGEELQEKGMEEMALVGKGKGKKDMLVESDSIRGMANVGFRLRGIATRERDGFGRDCEEQEDVSVESKNRNGVTLVIGNGQCGVNVEFCHYRSAKVHAGRKRDQWWSS